MARLLPDPPSRSGAILTRRELDASLRVLEAIRRPHSASVTLSWDNDMQDALGGLQRARYVETQAASGGRAPRKASSPFRFDKLAATELGIEYLDSIKALQREGSRHHATKKRKTGDGHTAAIWKYIPPRIGIFDGKTFHPSAPVTTVILHPPIGGGVHPKTAIRGDWHLAEIITPFGTRTYGFADGYITSGLKFAVKLGPGQERDEVIAKWKSAPSKP